jgi:hypothetical protein
MDLRRVAKESDPAEKRTFLRRVFPEWVVRQAPDGEWEFAPLSPAAAAQPKSSDRAKTGTIKAG